MQYKVIGVMSGSSLDGVDLAYCEFWLKDHKWNFRIFQTQTIPYPDHWFKKLKGLHRKNIQEIREVDIEYSNYISQLINNFIHNNKLTIDFISSHGHTVLHQPENKLTLQIGNGKIISEICGADVVSDFRSKDVELGGQGAPLVPVGDMYLFSEYKYCLNLGGIANISIKENKKITAFDICPCNLILNYLAEKKEKLYDENGDMSAQGVINKELLTELNRFNFFSLHPPKSLGKESIEKYFFPILDKYYCSIEDKLASCIEIISSQICNNINTKNSMLITGGGALNKFLIKKIKKKQPFIKVVIPNQKLVKYKEALIFALLGILKIKNEINCLSSVTGAVKDSCCGVIFKFSKN